MRSGAQRLAAQTAGGNVPLLGCVGSFRNTTRDDDTVAGNSAAWLPLRPAARSSGPRGSRFTGPSGRRCSARPRGRRSFGHLEPLCYTIQPYQRAPPFYTNSNRRHSPVSTTPITNHGVTGPTHAVRAPHAADRAQDSCRPPALCPAESFHITCSSSTGHTQSLCSQAEERSPSPPLSPFKSMGGVQQRKSDASLLRLDFISILVELPELGDRVRQTYLL
ncbi:hypothetical protein AAFF_G00100930 [Aldrovandia affinis]|uniref:Uncharacterized protein n=1 Tax=Aldrovandia affinis TaxID=143900 RepID=A0AAD7RUV4_9TELE|nr:hypothetical protein AAFF_G00100930 [Aldrovandia affinis]